MVNTPIPHSLKSEAKKAAKILREFSIPSAKTGPDSLIPAGILAKAKGLAIITVFKAGFLVTARGGSGIVIAKLSDSIDFAADWSAPSAIGLAGLGGGFEVGLEVTDFVIILTTKSAVEAFSKGGNLTLGGNFTIAAGPLGRNLEGDIAVRSPAAIYTYSKTKGIFAGISIEGSALIERKDANKKFYGKDIRAHQILSGEVSPPEGCQGLYEVLKDHQEFAVRAAADLAKRQAQKHKEKIESMSEYSRHKFTRPKSVKSNSPSSTESGRSRSGNSSSPMSSSSSGGMKESWTDSGISPKSASSNQDGSTSRDKSTPSVYDPWQEIDKPVLKGATARPTDKPVLKGATAKPTDKPVLKGATARPTDKPVLKGATARPTEYDRDSSPEAFWVVADYTFQGELSCDLSFRAGDRIKVTTRTSTQQDWWEGIDKAGRQGIFPANFVHIVSK